LRCGGLGAEIQKGYLLLRPVAFLIIKKVLLELYCPVMVWTHQLLCCESSIFFLFLIQISFRRVPVCPGRWRIGILFSLLSMFFISVMPSEICRFKFAVSWLCDDHIAADNLPVEKFSTSRYDSPLSALSKDFSFQRLTYI
jgi:hypothetical protein